MRFVHLFCAFLALAAGCAASPEAIPVSAEHELSIDNGFLRQSIDLPTPAGVVHTEVVFRASAWSRHDRRVIVMIPGTLANGAGYYDTARGTGYDAAEILARRGHFVVLVDLPGSGSSYRPASGIDTGTVVAANAVRTAALTYRWLVGADGGVDLYGETGVGTSVGLLLARESWVRSYVASATAYEVFGPAGGSLFDPGFRGFVRSFGGYFPQDPGFIGSFFPSSDPAIVAQAVAACMGPAPQEIGTGTFEDLWAIPFTVGTGPFGPEFTVAHPIVEAAPAVAPALFIQGSPDPLGSEAGAAVMTSEYGSTGGGAATLVVLPGATHLMRFDIGIADGPSSPFWSAFLDFLASH